MCGSSLIVHLRASEDGRAALRRLFSLEYAALRRLGVVRSRCVTREASASFSAAGRKTTGLNVGELRDGFTACEASSLLLPFSNLLCLIDSRRPANVRAPCFHVRLLRAESFWPIISV